VKKLAQEKSEKDNFMKKFEEEKMKFEQQMN
jgi:hypothetical protein